MYFQTQRDIWCHLVTGTLPNAGLLAEAYQSWISLPKYSQSLAKKKLEISSWTSTKSTAKSCSQRLFRNRCNYMTYSFEAWSALQDYQGACGVDPRSMQLSVIQEHEIIEMLSCFSELLKELKMERQNYISHQPFANDPRCRSAPEKMIYGRYAKPTMNEATGVKLDIAAAGDQRHDYITKIAEKKIDMLQEEGTNGITDYDCPQEFNVDNSEGETSGSTESGSEDSETENSDETKSCDSQGTLNYELKVMRNMTNPPKRFNSTDSLITNDNSDGDHSSESETSSRLDDTPASYSNSEDILNQLESAISELSIGTFANRARGDSSDENKDKKGWTKEYDGRSDSASSGFEFIEHEDYFTYDDFDHDLPPRPNTS